MSVVTSFVAATINVAAAKQWCCLSACGLVPTEKKKKHDRLLKHGINKLRPKFGNSTSKILLILIEVLVPML